MTVDYRGYEIDVRREKCLAGYDLLYYSVFRKSDQYECTSGYEDSSETVRTMIKNLKRRVDNEHATDDPWGEKADDEHFG